jgi:hypothetical protein
MFDSLKVFRTGAAENNFIAACIPPQKPTDIMLKIRRNPVSVMDHNHCTYEPLTLNMSFHISKE